MCSYFFSRNLGSKYTITIDKNFPKSVSFSLLRSSLPFSFCSFRVFEAFIFSSAFICFFFLFRALYLAGLSTFSIALLHSLSHSLLWFIKPSFDSLAIFSLTRADSPVYRLRTFYRKTGSESHSCSTEKEKQIFMYLKCMNFRPRLKQT